MLLSKHPLKNKLTKQQFDVLRKGKTEPAFTGKYYKNKETGKYFCAGCGAELFSSDAKFDSSTGWPSFDKSVNSQSVELREDVSLGMKRVEVLCKKCGGHLGHLFEDVPTKTKQRFCINSCALEFKKEE